MSHDLEDVVCILDGRPALEEKIANSTQEIRRYVCGRLQELLGNSHFMDALPGHLPGDAGSQARLPSLISKLERLAVLAT